MSKSLITELILLCSAFALAYAMFVYADRLPLPITIIGAILMMVMVIKGSKTKDVN